MVKKTLFEESEVEELIEAESYRVSVGIVLEWCRAHMIAENCPPIFHVILERIMNDYGFGIKPPEPTPGDKGSEPAGDLNDSQK